MPQKRKGDGCSRMYRSAEEDRNEMMRLTKVAKSWEFTCSFCFKKFPSAQAMGGHQNAHRSQRLEEKRLFVKDPIAYRKRAFLEAIKADHHEGGRLGQPVTPNSGFNNRSWSGCKGSSSSEGNGKNAKINVMMRMSSKDEEDEVEFDVGGCGMNLDLSLKM